MGSKVTLIVFGVSIIYGGYHYREYSKYKSGLIGEKGTLSLLSDLPADWYILNDVTVTVDGNKSQLDIVVVAPNGIFVIETKNHNGDITGNIEDHKWVQNKIGRRGTPYSNSIYSPVKQVETHVWRLSQFLKLNGFNAWVTGIVYFSNKEASVNIRGTNDRIPVYSYYESKGLLDFLRSNVSNKRPKYEELEKIANLLDSSL